MKRYLLDTNICVRFMRQKFGVDEHIEKVGWEHCCISEVTVAELLILTISRINSNFPASNSKLLIINSSF